MRSLTPSSTLLPRRPRLRIATTLAAAVALAACTGSGPGAANLPDVPTDADAASDLASDLSELETGDTPGDVESDGQGTADTEDTALPVECAADQCALDGACIDNETTNPDNPCEICLVAVDPAAWSADDTATCDDDDACTSDDHCAEGACMGTVDPCEDGSPCTIGVCDPETGECSQGDADGACSDGDPCTSGDHCGGGSCLSGGPRDCDDGNPCTADRCEAGVGCVSDPLAGVACDDGDPCTVGDACDGGACIAGPEPLDCDDENVCTVDYCDPVEGCGHDSLADLCADDNPCTDEACDPFLGCVFPFNEADCNDTNACTFGDVCVAGACLGTPVNLDDENVCTDVTCDPETGVSVSFNTLPCDDLDACTVGDACADGSCVSGTEPLSCSDGNVCTDDECDPATGCVFPPNTDGCDDLDACTTDDVCGNGECGGTLVVCDDGNACTRNECDAETGCNYPLILSFACRPGITIDYPPRAATVQGTSGTIDVTGHVASGAGPIESFTLNGAEVTLAEDGTFSVPFDAVVGGNILSFVAVDSFGTRVERVQSFLYSPVYRQPHDAEARTGMVVPGLGLFLSQEVLDDGNRGDGYDDFATIFQSALGGLDLGGFIDPTTPLGSFLLWDVYALGLSIGTPQVALDANAGRLDVTVTFTNLSVPVGIVFIWNGPPTSPSGYIRADTVTVQVPVHLTVVNHQVVVSSISPSDVTVSFNNLRFVASGSGFGSDLLSFVVNLFSGTLESEMRSALQDAVANQLAPILGSAFNGVAFDATLPFPSLVEGADPVNVRLITDFDSVSIANAGITLRERAGAYSDPMTPYANLGAMGRAGCRVATQTLVVPGVGVLELSLADDTLNEILYSAWRGGLLEFTVPPELLGDVDFGSLGITDLELVASGMLQPTAFDCSPDGALLLHLGDLYIDATMQVAGLPLEVDIYTSLLAELSLTANDEGIALTISGVRTVDTEVSVRDESRLAFEPLIEGAISDALGPGLLSLLGGADLGTFPLPPIPLDGVVPGIPEGTAILIHPTDLDRVSGNTVVTGTLMESAP